MPSEKRKRSEEPIAELHAPVWRKQPREPQLLYASFKQYRDAGADRSIARLSRETGKDLRMLWSRSKRWRWAERVDLWDSHCEEIAIRAQEEAVRKMNAEHATIAFEGLRLVMQRLVGDDAAGVTAIDPNRLSARDIAALAPVLAKMERLARGAETERVENAGRPIEIKFAFDPTPKIIGDLPGPSDPRDFPAESSN